MRATLMLITAVTIFVLRPENAWACKCARANQLLPATKWIAGFNGAVFRGQVKRITEVRVPVVVPNARPDSYAFDLDVTFDVQESWKGSNTSEITIRTGVGNGDCGVGYVKGKTYFVAADHFDSRFVTSICTTVGLDMNTIASLGKGRRPLGK